jgi:NADPH2:quinone reductase
VYAWQATALAEPEQALTLTDVPVPEPGPGQLLVKVRATALNFPDVLLCRGQYQIRLEPPFVPGVELCGEVVGLGPGVDERLLGSRVIGNPVLPNGALAEFTLMTAAEAYPAPESLDDAEASALHIGYQTGWFALHRRAHLQEGETVLVHAAAGGVGSAAVELAKAAGAKVIGVVGGAAKAEIARNLGADLVIDRKTRPRTSSARSRSSPMAAVSMWSSIPSAVTRTTARPSASRSRAGSSSSASPVATFRRRA